MQKLDETSNSGLLKMKQVTKVVARDIIMVKWVIIRPRSHIQEGNMEIERKFLVKEIPENLGEYPCRRIEQAYLCTKPVVRVRRYGEEFWLTCKGEGLLAREEYELPLTADAYRHLLAKADGLVIEKDRYCIPWEGHTIELDVFDGSLAPLVFAEVEFSTEVEALAFVKPDWFGRDVTWDGDYSNAALSRFGKPKSEG